MKIDEQLHNALKRLVELKGHEDADGKDDEYEQDMAWYKAEKALEQANKLATIDGRVVCKDCGKLVNVEYNCQNGGCERAYDKNP